MLFNSPEFFVFFLIVYALYRLLDLRGQNRMLLAASYLFYGWWDIRFLYLLVLSTALDYCCGLLLGPGRIPGRDRLKVSVLTILASLLFVTLDWKAVRWVDPAAFRSPGEPAAGSWGTIAVDWGRLVSPDWLGVSVLVGTVAAVFAANLLYYPLTNMQADRRRRVGVWLTVGANLTLLGFFKYFNFFIDSFARMLEPMGVPVESLHLHVILPAGISFYTFQSMSYTLDVYRGKVEAVRSLEDYALFVTFFPVLVAGPIERVGHMLPKLTTPRVLNLDQTTRGCFLILFGLFKKVAVADSLAVSVNSVFNAPSATWADVVLATVGFAFQIYCDFSGYTDVARGVAKVLGIDLMLNFNLPYFSRTPSEFWTRWHISLSSWLRDYLYIPLGGSRGGEGATYRNLMITMLLGGLWHGAAWNFVLWGAYQGAILCLYRLFTPRARPADLDEPSPAGGLDLGRRIGAVLSTGFFFVLTCYGWMLFRAGSLEQVVDYTRILLSGPFDLHTTIAKPTTAGVLGLPLLIAFECLEYSAGTRLFYRSLPSPVRGALYALLLFILVMGTSNAATQFIYFQF
ncbi:MBOAT family O-acyltransferase [Planctomyces sp. SH-PL62]|uniref:MBOAT family O-acyltransferase n=1 Tax=Planctomyces sp. SH-PL62 TaxID=1636152 RepID=UPI00078C3DDC|nr:MBOAT family O-acyltransferase [Planctomyces sp. SH-PL62]AMV38289.1 Peptidoglycan O-acetyltransferase [Planctomyces sp. SH-PL62]